MAWALGIALGCVAVHPSQLLEHHLVRVRGRAEVRGFGFGFGFGLVRKHHLKGLLAH